MRSALERFSNEPLPAGRIALVVAYQGSLYHGWQAQLSDHDTVQGALQKALSRVAAHDVALSCAGRTDAGVHATAQVVHFDTLASRSPHAWVAGTNHFLPPDIVVRWAGPVSTEFHARYSATAREYRYVILNQTVPPAQRHRQSTWIHYPLDEQRMHHAAQLLLGTHDFSALRAAECQSKTPVRELHSINVSRHGDYVLLQLRANAFLHHMVRNITGTLLPIGEGTRPVSWISEVLASRDRRCAGITAPAHGLYLVGVDYPAHFCLPALPKGPAVFPPEI
ncbi:MAG: tRNA pseudouridine(38-40) synthase TruA [unclassified Hahellaceae]|nr:tRNA pseudouridine(38-40) synthase TruA [Hahellaceae bacterium]